MEQSSIFEFVSLLSNHNTDSSYQKTTEYEIQ